MSACSSRYSVAVSRSTRPASVTRRFARSKTSSPTRNGAGGLSYTDRLRGRSRRSCRGRCSPRANEAYDRDDLQHDYNEDGIHDRDGREVVKDAGIVNRYIVWTGGLRPLDPTGYARIDGRTASSATTLRSNGRLYDSRPASVIAIPLSPPCRMVRAGLRAGSREPRKLAAAFPRTYELPARRTRGRSGESAHRAQIMRDGKIDPRRSISCSRILVYKSLISCLEHVYINVYYATSLVSQQLFE